MIRITGTERELEYLMEVFSALDSGYLSCNDAIASSGLGKRGKLKGITLEFDVKREDVSDATVVDQMSKMCT